MEKTGLGHGHANAVVAIWLKFNERGAVKPAKKAAKAPAKAVAKAPAKKAAPKPKAKK